MVHFRIQISLSQMQLCSCFSCELFREAIPTNHLLHFFFTQILRIDDLCYFRIPEFVFLTPFANPFNFLRCRLPQFFWTLIPMYHYFWMYKSVRVSFAWTGRPLYVIQCLNSSGSSKNFTPGTKSARTSLYIKRFTIFDYKPVAYLVGQFSLFLPNQRRENSSLSCIFWTCDTHF